MIAQPALDAPTQSAPMRSTQLCYESRQILRGSKEIVIDHHGQRYLLKLTRNDKLILHK